MPAFKRIIALLIFAAAAVSLTAQGRSYGRSVVATQYGIVATSQVIASQAGARVLEQGGSAIDAAIAANAVLNVTEPNTNGMGGDLFAIYWEAKTGKLYGLNASGWAPRALTIDHLHAKGVTAMPQEGIDSVTVPGVVDGWTKLHDRWGRLPWRGLFQPAIFYAQNGFPVAEIIRDWWAGDRTGLLTNPESTRVFVPGGKVPETGQMFRNPDVAHALTLVADEGESAFYKGAIAKAILKTSDDLGGAMTDDDLASYSAEWVEPVSTTYRDWTVYELPPNGDGIAALEMLNIMEQFKPDAAGPHSPGELHNRIEAMKLAYADVKAYDGDPRFSKIPVDQLLSKTYAAKRAALIDPAHANCTVAPGALGASDTTYFSVVDREGNILSIIQSNYNNFWLKRHRGRHGICSAESRGPVFARSSISQCAGRPQASFPHHYSGIHAARRSAHWLRHHGRTQPAACTRAICLKRRRLPHEHSSRHGRTAFYRPPAACLQNCHRVARNSRHHRRAHQNGSRS